MNRKAHIAAGIAKNRIALLRMVFCWLSAVMCLNVRGDKPLPRRLARFVAGIIFKAEKATGYLLIAVFYQSQITKRFNPAFERAAMNLIASNRSVTLGALTITGIIKRLKALQQTLHNLRTVVQRLSKSIAAHARVLAIKIAAMCAAQNQLEPKACLATMLDDALPP